MKYLRHTIKTILISALALIIFNWLVNITEGERFYTPDEVVASVICAEAVGERYVGLYAVSNVVKNRANQYKISPYKVVTQKNQFYGYTNPNREKLYMQNKDYCDYLSKNLMKLDDITGGALYFRRVGEKKQSWHLKRTIKIKNHIFYK